jgi:hypothetical protein
MNVLKKKIPWVVLPLIAAAIYGLSIALSPLPTSVIDRDQSGIVSFGEALNASDVEQRPGENGPGCIEYFWLKDGLPAYEQCSS